MIYLTERTEIAKFFNEHPVIRINAETPKEAGTFKGELVKVLTPSKSHPTLYCTGYLYHFTEGGKDSFSIISGGAIISGSFGYQDVLECYEKNHAPTVTEGDTVGVLEDFPNKKQCRIRVMTVEGSKTMVMHGTCYLKDFDEAYDEE